MELKEKTPENDHIWNHERLLQFWKLEEIHRALNGLPNTVPGLFLRSPRSNGHEINM